MGFTRRLAFILTFLVLCSCKEPPDTTATGTTVTTATTVPPDGPYVGHFQFWTVEKLSFDDAIRANVKGQFGSLDIRLGSLDFLGNPAQKDDEPVNDQYKDLHLTAYTLDQPPPFDVRVLVSNQFIRDQEEWALGGPRLLLLPAIKRHDDQLPAEPPKGPHFLCHEVREAPPLSRPTRISDQFHKQEVRDLRPRYLCIPADKNGEGMWNETVHLALYEFQGFAQARTVYTKDQFGNRQLKVQRSVMLGVPSKKTLVAR